VVKGYQGLPDARGMLMLMNVSLNVGRQSSGVPLPRLRCVAAFRRVPCHVRRLFIYYFSPSFPKILNSPYIELSWFITLLRRG
jgi:hypothetical protein